MEEVEAQESSLTRAKLIDNLREINAIVKENEEKIINSQSPRQLSQLLRKSDSLFEKITTPSSLTHDCATMVAITNIAVSQGAAINLCPASVNLPNVLSNLSTKFPDKREFDSGGMDFKAIGDWVLRRSRVVPPSTLFLYGLGQFKPVHKERNKTQRAPKDVIQESKSVGSKETDESRSSKLMSRARKLCEKLKEKGNTPVAVVISAPDSFSKTVENAFDLAHLVREGKIGIHSDNDKNILATVEDKKVQKCQERRQCILHLRQSDYQRMIENNELKCFLD